MIKNKSVTYILPLFCKYFASENKELEETIFVSFLKNCYVFVKNNNNIIKNFTIQFEKPEKNEIFEKFIVNLKNSNIFVEYYDDVKLITFRFIVPTILEDIYYFFIEGKYSEYKEEDKKIILEFCKNWTSLELSMKVLKIFSKSEVLRKELEAFLHMKIPESSELSSKPDIELETFNLDLINV